MESLVRGTALLVGFGLIAYGAVLMARTKRASAKDAAHIKLFGMVDIKTSSAGALLVGVGMAIFLPGLLLRPQPEPVAAPSQAGSNVNLNVRGDGNLGVGTMSGGSINMNVQKNAPAK